MLWVLLMVLDIIKKTMKTRNILILVILLAISFYIGFKSNKVEVVKTNTVTKIDTITNVIDNTKPTKIEKVFIKVSDTITVTKNDTVKVDRVVFKDKQVNKYTYIDTVKNGRLEATILADTIYKRDIKLTTFNKETTTDNYIIPSNIMLGLDTNLNNGIQQSSLNLYYIHKDRWLVKAGLGFDFRSKTQFYSVGIGFKF